jgi:hypothetical protein
LKRLWTNIHEPHRNPSTETREFSLREPEASYVTISALV